MSGYSDSEMMIVCAARQLEGVRSVLVGVGLPNIACNLARRTVAPDLELVYESGVLGARPARLPLSIGDPTIVSGARSVFPMPDLFHYLLEGGRIEVGLLGTAQIDRFGNLNTTVIGEYTAPKVRLPGSGGACEIALHAQKTFIITRLSRRTFVEGLDFITSPGFKRDQVALPGYGSGPSRVITDKAMFAFDTATHEMTLSGVYPDVEIEEVKDHIAWNINISKHLVEIAPPEEFELDIIRKELDPEGMYR
ncbi:MAG: CoA-transferase [Anaerolineales bacterium]|jgi:glutaconate CoA-transferase subunit B